MHTKWTDSGRRANLSGRVMSRVRHEAPLKSRIAAARGGLGSQVEKLAALDEKLRRKERGIFDRIVAATKSNDHSHARMYASELAEVRKILRIVDNAKLSLEQIRIRLDTISEMGDIVVTLTPCMAVIKDVSASVGGLIPEANSSIGDLSRILGEVLSDSQVGDAAVSAAGAAVAAGAAGGASPEASSILDEAQALVAGQAKASLPDLPDNLKQDILSRREAYA